MKKLLLAVAALPLVAACASGPETSTNAQARARPDDGEFTTGSNIPRRNRMGGDGVSVMSKEEFERARTAGGQGGQGLAPGTAQ